MGRDRPSGSERSHDRKPPPWTVTHRRPRSVSLQTIAVLLLIIGVSVTFLAWPNDAVLMPLGSVRRRVADVAIVAIIAYVGTLLVGELITLASGRSMVEVDANGLSVRSRLGRSRFIPWEEILSVEPRYADGNGSDGSQELIGLDVHVRHGRRMRLRLLDDLGGLLEECRRRTGRP